MGKLLRAEGKQRHFDGPPVALVKTVKHSGKAAWGGNRKGAGRKRTLKEKDREKTALTYYQRMQVIPAFYSSTGERVQPRRKAVIQKLANEKNITFRLIERILAEFLPRIRREFRAVREINEGNVQIRHIARWEKALKYHRLVKRTGS